MKVKCIRYTIENDNNDRTSMFGLRVGQWYDVLDQKIVDVGDPKRTNPLRNDKNKSSDYLSSRFVTIEEFREFKLKELGI